MAGGAPNFAPALDIFAVKYICICADVYLTHYLLYSLPHFHGTKKNPEQKMHIGWVPNDVRAFDFDNNVGFTTVSKITGKLERESKKRVS